ncbi:MAG: accB [Verrucomicrobiales bacterium]|nr:accB [Verrucomicrobiales bacterium]
MARSTEWSRPVAGKRRHGLTGCLKKLCSASLIAAGPVTGRGCHPRFSIPLKPDQEAILDLKEIRQIIEMMKRNDLSLFHLEREGFKIKLRKGVDFDTMVEKLGSSGVSVPAPHPVFLGGAGPQDSGFQAAGQGDSSADEGSESTTAPSGTSQILSPLVGSFYRATSPGEKPFVTVGDTVEVGTTVCIIEAMKVMNEVKAEARGVITRVLAEDATAVQYETPLFEIRPS